MARKKSSPLKPVLESDAVRDAARALIAAVQSEQEKRALGPDAYAKAIRDVERFRGRPLLYPMLAAGLDAGVNRYR